MTDTLTALRLALPIIKAAYVPFAKDPAACEREPAKSIEAAWTAVEGAIARADEVKRLRSALKAITQRANERHGGGLAGERDTVHAMHALAADALNAKS